MTMQMQHRKIEQLNRLYTIREKRALALIAEQRIELQRVQDALSDQNALINELQEQLKNLHQLRSSESIHSMTASSLRAESDRRRALTQDLEMENFYLPGFESDVREAAKELAMRQRSWARIRNQIQAFNQMTKTSRIETRRIQERRQEALLDEQTTNS